MNVWIRHCQSQGQVNGFACDITNRSKLPRSCYNHFWSCLFFMLKRKQLHIGIHSIDRAVYCFILMMSKLHETGCRVAALYCGLIADLYIHINDGRGHSSHWKSTQEYSLYRHRTISMKFTVNLMKPLHFEDVRTFTEAAF